MRFADAGAIKSGTANLEAALAGLPFVMFYRASFLTELIVKLIAKTRTFSIVNYIRPSTIKELIQKNFTPNQLAAELERLLFDRAYSQDIKNKLLSVKESLNPPQMVGAKEANAAVRTANLVLSLADAPMRQGELYKRSLSYLRPYTRLFVLALICMVLFGASDGVIPFIVKYMLDGVFNAQNETLLYLLPIFLVVFAAVRAAVDFGQQYLLSKVGHNVVKDIRNAVNRHILALSPEFFLLNSSGNLLTRITSDVMLVRGLLTEAVSAILRDAVRIVALLGAAVYLDPTLALIALVGVPLGVYPIYRFGRRMRKLARRGQSAIGALSALMQESIHGHQVVKAFRREKYEQQRFEDKNEELTRTFLKSEFVRALTGPVNEILAALAISGVIVYGGISVM
ncbi:MAG: hypothetical protein KDD53_11875, partial [Bdellovibrionales bacterium]|nr:hypothetical protein [Bdellovibrionales bacterium]